MTRLLLIPLVAALLAAGDGPKKTGDKKPAADDRAKLQGTWVVVKTVVDGKDKKPAQTEKITFRGNRIIFWDKMFKDGGKKPDEQIIFALDPSKKPKTMDLTFPAATTPEGKDFLFGRGIYCLEDDNLKLAFMTGNRGDLFPMGRPTSFEGKDKSTTTILKRQ